MKYRDVKVSVRMFLDDFIEPPFRDYVVFYLQKIEQTLKLRVHHVFIYDEVETMKVKEFSDFVLDKLYNKVNKFLFVCFPYKANTEIHGFSYPDINTFADGKNVDLVARGGFFGGPKDSISDISGIYYNLLNTTLSSGYMGTEESLFSILLYRFPDKICYSEIEENGGSIIIQCT